MTYHHRGRLWGAGFRFFLLGALVVLFWALFSVPALATLQCAPYTRMTEVLASKYSEAPKAIGTVNQRRFMEVYVSKAGSWTILVTSADGNSCIVAAGQDWEDVPREDDR